MTKIDNFFEIKNAENFLRIDIQKIIYPNAENEWDKSWLKSNIKFELGAFRGEFYSDIQINDFLNFLEQLKIQNKQLKGKSSFNTREGQIEISLIINNLGIVEVTYQLIDKVGTGNELNGAFVIDQTYLPTIINY